MSSSLHNPIADLFEPVLQAPSLEAYKAESIKFACSLGFDLVNTDYCSPAPQRRWTSINNYPSAWLLEMPQYTEEFSRSDFNVRIFQAMRPVPWNLETYRALGLGHIAEAFQPHGFYAGIEVPATTPLDGTVSIGVARSKELPLDRAELLRVTGELTLFASFAAAALDRLLGQAQVDDAPRLTQKEFEVLKWTAVGKTAYEIGLILSISERTVNFHIQNMLRKFNVVNKQAAIARAVQHRILN